jgi:HxlR-like helix-turn-helix
MREPARSGCPINMAVEAFGDRWSLLVLRDVMFGSRHRFRELLADSEEGIASNILVDRLKRLTGDVWPFRIAGTVLPARFRCLAVARPRVRPWATHPRVTAPIVSTARAVPSACRQQNREHAAWRKPLP